MTEFIIVIALSGWKRSGKDTVADYLRLMHGYDRISFADPIKEQVCQSFGVTLEMINNPLTKEKPLLDMPVSPKDAFTKMVLSYMIREFRTADRQICDSFSKCDQLYWTPRALCILLGSSFRCANPNYWLQLALNKMSIAGRKLFVISDVRYVNEIETLKKHRSVSDELIKVVTVRINRFDTCDSTDASERELDVYNFDHVVENKGTVAELHEQIERILFSMN